jgi:hypothetical protein
MKWVCRKSWPFERQNNWSSNLLNGFRLNFVFELDTTNPFIIVRFGPLFKHNLCFKRNSNCTLWNLRFSCSGHLYIFFTFILYITITATVLMSSSAELSVYFNGEQLRSYWISIHSNPPCVAWGLGAAVQPFIAKILVLRISKMHLDGSESCTVADFFVRTLGS